VGPALVAAVLALGCLTAGPPPAGAAASDSDTLLWVPSSHSTYAVARNGAISPFDRPPSGRSFEGDFDGDPGTDVFLYNAGGGPDGVLHLEPTGTGVTTSFTPATVNGTYDPLVGDFDANGIDDILWYGIGALPDSLWRFTPSGAHATQTVTVNGVYEPVVIEANGDSYDDILWYQPGPGGDVMWRFGPGASHSDRSVVINGRYQVVAGHFGLRPEGSPQKRLVFFNEDGPDHIWTFDTAMGHTSAVLPAVDGSKRPIVGRFTGGATDDIFWYGPGVEPEAFTSFTDAGAAESLEPPVVHGAYGPIAVGDLDGNGFQDIAWGSGALTNIWSFHDGGYAPSQLRGPNGELRVGFTDPFDLG
jgi:hypothetical protein